ncbi:MAG: F0F1 ATP synthase subunit gamma, partial [Erysipelotrichaceae bacterium]|nr:F0F1 ATP synthase subunit gamma [Erysipelotrichaceae bacterium]
MESLNDIKKRIKSVNDISQLTRAMQLVSAAKMRKSKIQ